MIDSRMRHVRPFAAACGLTLVLAACSGGGGGDSAAAPPPASSVAVTGTLSAPGGALAFNAPTGVQRFFAGILGSNAVAALPGTAAVSGATVKLIEIDANGAQVGADIATASTAADGSFTLNAPAGFTPGAQYVIRAAGTSTLERMLTDLSAQDVDPATSATKALVLAKCLVAGSHPKNLQRAQLEQLLEHVAAQAADVDATSTATTAALLSALTTQAQDDEDADNALASLVAAGSIAGTVTDSAGTPLANIKVVAADFNRWLKRAETRTAANGQFTLNLAPGDYIVGALNFTAASMGASEWWTCNDTAGGPTCGAANMFSAGKVTVGASAATVNFKLEPGVRVQGTVTASGGTPALPGVHLMVRDFLSDQPAVLRRTNVDGTYRINLRPGMYTLGTRNRTRLPYAGGLYNGPVIGGTATASGGANASAATPMSLPGGSTINVSFELSEGGAVRGFVTDGTNPVTGIAVRFWDSTGQFVEAERTNRAGGYRMWLRPGTYAVRSRGQVASPTVVAFSADNNPAPISFTAVMGRATASMRDGAGNPIGQVKVNLYDTTAFNWQEFQISNSDGSLDLYAPTGSYAIEYKLDNGSTTTGSAIHDGSAAPAGKQLTAGIPVAFDSTATAPIALGTLTLPAGGELKGTVTVGGVATGNIIVQLRSGGTTGAFRFVATRTQANGSYSISVPAATYNRVCAFVPGTSTPCGATLNGAGFDGANNVVVTASGSSTQDFAIP